MKIKRKRREEQDNIKEKSSTSAWIDRNIKWIIESYNRRKMKRKSLSKRFCFIKVRCFFSSKKLFLLCSARRLINKFFIIFI